MGGGATSLSLIFFVLAFVRQVAFSQAQACLHPSLQGGGGGGTGGVGQRGAQQLHDGLPQPLQVDMFHISRISAHESPSFPRRQKKEGVDVSGEAESGLDRGTDQELLDDEEDVLDYYYDIETSAETMPNVNWTMLTPR